MGFDCLCRPRMGECKNCRRKVGWERVVGWGFQICAGVCALMHWACWRWGARKREVILISLSHCVRGGGGREVLVKQGFINWGGHWKFCMSWTVVGKGMKTAVPNSCGEAFELFAEPTYFFAVFTLWSLWKWSMQTFWGIGCLISSKWQMVNWMNKSWTIFPLAPRLLLSSGTNPKEASAEIVSTEYFSKVVELWISEQNWS